MIEIVPDWEAKFELFVKGYRVGKLIAIFTAWTMLLQLRCSLEHHSLALKKKNISHSVNI